jgi:hypothetical protein
MMEMPIEEVVVIPLPVPVNRPGFSGGHFV